MTEHRQDGFVWDPREAIFYASGSAFQATVDAAKRLPEGTRTAQYRGYGPFWTGTQHEDMFRLYEWQDGTPYELYVWGMGTVRLAPEYEDLVPLAERCPVCLEQRVDFLTIEEGPAAAPRSVLCESCGQMYLLPPIETAEDLEEVVLIEEEPVILLPCPGCENTWPYQHRSFDDEAAVREHLHLLLIALGDISEEAFWEAYRRGDYKGCQFCVECGAVWSD
jgi:hypothetical protein